ncbi:hypothetical protein [Candidatus Palauibacter sp.]
MRPQAVPSIAELIAERHAQLAGRYPEQYARADPSGARWSA